MAAFETPEHLRDYCMATQGREPVPEEYWNAATEAAKEKFNSSVSTINQQLKAEIATLNASIKLSNGDLFINRINVSERLRQLSE